jgi:hypothetical protein
MTWEITLERGSDGTYLAWVNGLPGCAVRGASRDEVLGRLPTAIEEFLVWSGAEATTADVMVIDEIDSVIEAYEDTEALVEQDRSPLTEGSWAETKRLLARSREELEALLDRLTDDELDGRREEIEHIAFVELMYAVWTFDLQTREGLAGFLAWTRGIASERMDKLARREAADLTTAHWGGAPRPEPWTPRKAARRLLWHELLHLRRIGRG